MLSAAKHLSVNAGFLARLAHAILGEPRVTFLNRDTRSASGVKGAGYERQSKAGGRFRSRAVTGTARKPGAFVRSAAGRISVQCVAGHMRMHVGGQAFDLPAGHLLALDRALSHDVEALEDSAFLLTISWPMEAKQA